MAQEDTGGRPPTPIIERVSALQQQRSGAPVRFACDDSLHPAFNFDQVQASIPQVFTASMALQSSWPPSSDIWKCMVILSKRSEEFLLQKLEQALHKVDKMYQQGLAMEAQPRRHRFLTGQQVKELKFVLQSEMNF